MFMARFGLKVWFSSVKTYSSLWYMKVPSQAPTSKAISVASSCLQFAADWRPE